MLAKETLESLFDDRRARFMDDLTAVLRIPSISADPNRHGDCRACAEWFVRHLAGIGFAAELLETTHRPVVYAMRPGAPERATVLFYGHYDVQPIDPEDQWESPPFEPTLRGDRLYARGACDNKGQVMYTLAALQTLIAEGVPLPTVKIVLEGEEECGSRGIAGAMGAWADRLRADVMLVHDTGMHRDGIPTVTMGLRGIIDVTVRLTGPEHDLHSGVHGGVCPNPAQGMAQLLATLFDADGAIAVPGFYDTVRPPTPAERVRAEAFPFDVGEYRQETGVGPTGGIRGRTPTERGSFLPSIDINGIHSGYGGAGVKTIIPATAVAKLSARVVPDQDPRACLRAIVEHLTRHVPDGLTLDIVEQGAAGPGFRLDPDSPLVRTAAAALSRLDPRGVLYRWEGASIPIVVGLAHVARATPLLVGFAVEADRIHAPNESFSLWQYRLGFLYAAMLLQDL